MEPSTSGVEVDAAGLAFIDSDGQPMAETGVHGQQMVILQQSLAVLAARRGWTDAYAGMNQFHCWDRGDARRCLAPDVYFVRGVAEPRRLRRTWKLWVEGRGPELVIEVASSDTWEEDVGRKRDVYRDVYGVREYVIVDPLACDPIPGGPLLAWRLSRGVYRRLGTSTGRLHSQVLDADLVLDDQGVLRIADTDGRSIPAMSLEALAAGHAEGHAAGHAAGLAAGLAEGRAQEARRLLERQLRRRFPAVPAALLARLQGAPIEDLERWSDRLLEATSAEDVFKA